MASAASSPQQPELVDAASLSLDHLVCLHKGLERKIQQLHLRLRSLRIAKNKLQESREALQLFRGLDSSSSKQQQAGDKEKAAGKVEDSTLGSTLAETGGEQEEKKEDRKDEEEQQLEVLVPLTGSLYVKGRLRTRERLLVDIGTGYWVEKTGEEAHGRLERMSGKVSEQIAKAETFILEKEQEAEASRTRIRQKFEEQQSLQQRAGAARRR